MKKLTIKKLIEFRGKSERAKKNFANNLKLNKVTPKPDSGGNYWTIAVSAIAKAFKEKDLQIISYKIKETTEKLIATKHPGTKAQYTSNIDLLRNYENFDFKKWIPAGKISSQKNHRSVLAIKDLMVETSPHHVFSFAKDDHYEIGAIWLIAKKGGYKREEMGMFTDILSRYLKNQYGKTYSLNPRYCIAVDLVNNVDVNYSQLEKAEVPALLNRTIEEIKRLM